VTNSKRNIPMALNKCPDCKKTFSTLDDERGQHDCPYCGCGVEEKEKEEVNNELH